MEPLRSLNFTNARLLIQQRCFGTLAHELGNVTSPLALIADVLDVGRTEQVASAAGTVRLVATSLARATTICRFLRGNTDPGALSPTTISDMSAWWTLCAPFAEDMLPTATSIRATISAVRLPMAQYEGLTWATIAITRFVSETRSTLGALVISSESGERGDAVLLRVTAAAPRDDAVPSRTRQLLQLAAWEMRRVGGRVLVADTDASLSCQIQVPLAMPA